MYILGSDYDTSAGRTFFFFPWVKPTEPKSLRFPWSVEDVRWSQLVDSSKEWP